MKLLSDTPLIDLNKFGIAKLSKAMARKLATATANHVGKTDLSKATVEDLLNYFPKRYEDRSNMMPISELYDGSEAAVELFVRVSGGFRVGRNRPRKAPPLYIFELSASDIDRTHKPIVVWWFVSGKAAKRIVNYWKKKFERGTRFVAYGDWEWDSRRNTFALKLAKPDELEILPSVEDADSFGLLKDQPLEQDGAEGKSGETQDKKSVRDSGKDSEEEIDSPELAMVHVGRRVPVYRKFGEFQTKRLREVFYDIFQNLNFKSIEDNLPTELCKTQKLISRGKAIKEIHFPPAESNLVDYVAARSKAHMRLIFEEFFWVSFALQLKRGARIKEKKGAKIVVTEDSYKGIDSLLPFTLTGAQDRVVKQILSDMESDSPMNRLIQGDVGSGKTILAFIAMFVAMECGYQTALMAPTEILAEQHVRNAKEIFADSSYKVDLLIGGLRAAPKRKVQKELAEGKINAIIGTHALIQESVEFKRLGLIVIDEQHRFGVLQRALLKERGYSPDILVMTATPIPRSLAMTVYGDLDVSVIDELPPGRTPIKTVVVGEDQRKGVYKGIEREVELGRQVYIVYPLIEESEKLDLKAATKMYDDIRTKTFPDYKIGLLHGKMKSDEKDATMQEFVAGKLNILISTTVIEVGVDVPNASLMIIEHAERFGLSQLHQLRGRVGRGAEQSFCVLLTGDKKTAVARERLGIMEETSDGFKIAEKDLEIRGQGDILGTRQSGIQTFKIGNIIRDLDILEEAKEEAGKYLTLERYRKEAMRLIEVVKEDTRFGLAGIG